jgi:predicted nucleic acid-binding protein
MVQVIFLDTNVILDYLENRNQEVRDVIAQSLLLHKKGRIILATSVFNIAELIDQEFQNLFYKRMYKRADVR